MRLAHLSDLHLYAPGALRAADLLGRRAAGAANLFLARRPRHSETVARRAVAAIVEAGVDHCVVTGDLTNLSLEGEFRLATDVLAPLGGRRRLTVIPGNHDYYTVDAVREARFERHFASVLWERGERPAWPVVKDFPGVRLIAARSAALPPPLLSFGLVGAEQRDAIARAVEAGREAGRFVVVAVHHNLHRRGPMNETIGRLLDRDELGSLLAAAGAGLVLQGHDHREREFDLPRPGGGAMRVVGCGSSSLDAPGHPGRFNVYVIEAGRLGVERWEHRPLEGRFVRRDA
jgi:3',5'-cyclic AMP phosphodiesterase CpdA